MYWTEKHLLIFFCKEKLMFCGQHMAMVIQKNWFLHMALPQFLLRDLGQSLHWSSVQESSKFMFASHYRDVLRATPSTLVCLFPPTHCSHAKLSAFSFVFGTLVYFTKYKYLSSTQSPATEHPVWGPDSQQGREKDNPAVLPKLWCAQHFQRREG